MEAKAKNAAEDGMQQQQNLSCLLQVKLLLDFHFTVILFLDVV